MGQGTQAEQDKGKPTGTSPEQGKPGTGPGQLGQEPQHQSEKGLQPIPDRKEDNEKDSDLVNQAEQNKNPTDPDGSGTEQKGRGFSKEGLS